ncbi:MAG: Ldh family oxidoreductase [Isosphaeraceae bacterium]
MAEAFPRRLDDLKRFTAGLLERLGVPPANAALVASRVLWFEAADAAHLGIATLPELLDHLASSRFDPRSEGRIGSERNGTAVFDACQGIPLLVLARAAELAMEKGRDAGVGLVRVDGVGPLRSAAGIVAEVAVGPFAALALGPSPGEGAGNAFALAIPGPTGLPLVYDPALATPKPAGASRRKPAARPSVLPGLDLALLDALRPERSWLVGAVSTTAFEPLTALQERAGHVVAGLEPGEGRLLPEAWERRRRAARDEGVRVSPEPAAALASWAHRLGVPLPDGWAD